MIYKALPRLVTIKEKADFLGVTQPTAKKWDREGHLDSSVMFKIRADAYNDAFKVNPDVADMLQSGLENLFIKVLAYSNALNFEDMPRKEAMSFASKIIETMTKFSFDEAK